MPVYPIERRVAEALEVTAAEAEGCVLVDDEGMRWLDAFLSVDSRKTYCLYDAPCPEAIARAALRAGLPADVVVEATGRVLPDGSLQPV
jgi:hypothetical protein